MIPGCGKGPRLHGEREVVVDDMAHARDVEAWILSLNIINHSIY